MRTTSSLEISVATLTAALVLGGCAAFMRETPHPGEPRAEVVAKLGPPSAVYPDPPGQVLEYATGPMGQSTWMARIGPDGRLLSFEQVLTGEKFATIKVGAANKQDVLRIIGRPAETGYLRLGDYEVWSYRYKESNVWDSMMHVHFDRGGIVRMMLNGHDPIHQYEGPAGD